ncbi:small nuclear RNA activating complex, polypeptide 3 [Mortierella alpina]|nr:small nuclear RNA activating complex, polypeptide 3 [Mortierella alpina]
MSHAASGSSSCPQAQGLRQTGTSEQLSDETVTSIINVAPQGALFPVLPFGLSFTRLIDEQREHDAYHEYFDDCEQEQEVAERCDVWDDLQDANKFFDDPTLRGLLQEWYEGRLEECKDPIDKALRPTWSSIYGQVDEVTEYGDRSNLHLKEHPRPPGLGDENVQRLLGASVRGRRRVLSNSDRFAVRIGAEKRRRLFLEEPKRRQMRAKWGRPWDVVAPAAEKRDEQHESSTPVGEGTSEPSSVTASASGLVPISTTATATASTPAPAAASAPTTTLVSTAESAVASTASSAAASTAAQASATTSAAIPAHIPASESEANNSLPTTDESTATKSTAQPQPRTDKTGPPERTDQDDLDLVLEVSEKRAEEDERVGTTPLEDRFHTQSMAVEDSSLQSLAERNRFEVPVELRPEIIVSVALYSSLNPTKRTQEFLFLGSQPLTALRDAFHCISDFVNQGAEEQQDSPIKNKSDKKISNSFIFIEGVFYTDTPLSRAKIDKRNELRDKERKQLQQHELGSSKERSKGKGVARRAEAAEELDDADFREQRNQTGYQDVPLEQIKLKDEHLYAAASQDYGHHRYDDQNLLSYPKAIFKSKQTRHRCRMCNTNPAFYITIDDRLAGETPSYFCEECYDVFHYDEDGNILYDDFKVFLYAHDEAK